MPSNPRAATPMTVKLCPFTTQDGSVVLWRDGAAHRRTDAQNLEIGPRHHLARNPLRLAAEAHADRRGDTAQDAAEHLIVREEVLVHGVGEAVRAAVVPHMIASTVEQDELGGVLNREQAQHELVDERENRSVGANAESQ